MSKRTVSGITLTLLFIGMLTFAFNIEQVKAEATTMIVPDDYMKIQWAIGNASDGDTIFVRTGTYYEHVVVSKSVSLIGENRHNTIVDGSGTGTVINVTANNVNISSLTALNSGSAYQRSGIFIKYAGGCNISDTNLTGNYHGIYLEYSSHNTFTENNITNNWYGVRLYDSSNHNTISGNTITNNGHGIPLQHSNYNSISRNTMTANTYDGIGYISLQTTRFAKIK